MHQVACLIALLTLLSDALAKLALLLSLAIFVQAQGETNVARSDIRSYGFDDNHKHEFSTGHIAETVKIP